MKLAVRYYHDPKITGLPDADTELMFVRGLARAGEVARGGFIPEADLGLLARRRRMDSCVEALVASRLWSRVPGGYQVNAWADWQSAADALAARRMADRERQRKHRTRAPSRDKPKSRDIANLSRDVTDTELEEEPVETNPSSDLRGGPVENSGEGLVDQAVALAAKRYGESQVTNGSGGKSATALARWWLECFAADARVQAKALLAEYDLGKTQLADALLEPNPPWLRHYRRRETAT